MGENKLISSVIAAFPPTTREQWQRAASAETGTENILEELSWRSNDGLRFFPYYDEGDVAKHNFSKQYALQASGDAVFGARKWLCAPYVSLGDEESANKICLAHLNAGADALFIDVCQVASIDFALLLHEISWPHCSLLFALRPDQGSALLEYLGNAGFSTNTISGCLFWDKMPGKDLLDAFFAAAPQLHVCGIRMEPSTPVSELSSALLHAVNLVRSCGENLDETHQALRSIAFSISVGTDFMETIAKLKALRALWFQICCAYDVPESANSDTFIHAVSAAWSKESYEPHANLIKSTTAAMASILGGADALTVEASDMQNVSMNRIARNVSSILREESHFGRVADPTAGAYTLDVMTDRIAEAAWLQFQENVGDAS